MNRRTFLGQSGRALFGAAGMAMVADLARIGAFAQTGGDYKALVCVFLFGGNDGDNTFIPRSTPEYNKYATIRGGIAIPQAQILPISPLNSTGGIDFGFNPAMPELQGLFNNGKAAVVTNVGPLVRPVTKADYNANRNLPLSLFSHHDQQVAWMTSKPQDTMTGSGWGGRLADAINSLNTNPQVSMSISTFGTNNYQAADLVYQYPVSPFGGSLAFDGVTYGASDGPSAAFTGLVDQIHPGLFETEYGKVQKRAIDADRAVRTALQNVTLATTFPNSYLGAQLRTIAKLIAARTTLGFRRQVFFCGIGGFDTHGDQATEQPPLLQQLSQGLNAFYNATVELNVANNVAAFTMSDFGRSRFNGRGTDHGWGSHHFVVGGGVNGKRIFGQFPDQTLGSNDDSGDGRWIPTTGGDQMASTLALWFGLQQNNLSAVLPNIGNFATSNLGFML
jgi:uncharacterized protein (DUF1501 family)